MPAHEFLQINLENLVPAEQRFAGMAKRAQDLTPVWQLLHKAFQLEMKEQFATQGAHQLGQQWAPLSPAYAARKPVPPPPFGILYRTGDLYRSLTNEQDSDHIKVIRANGAVFGSAVPYGMYHQTGTSKMPQRKVISVTDRFRQISFRATVLYLLTGNLPDVNVGTGEVIGSMEATLAGAESIQTVQAEH